MSRQRFRFHGKNGARDAVASGFTLIELLLASFAGALVLAVIYGVFTGAVRTRDKATIRAHDAQLRQRAAMTIRTDLRNGYVSGGVLAAALEGSDKGPESKFPGYLRFTTTTGKDTEGELRGDVQEVSYYVATDEDNPSNEAGMLVRALDRTLLGRIRETTREEQLLPGVSSLELSFYDGSTWTDTWNYTPPTSGTNAKTNMGNTTLPKAVRMRITQVASSPKVPAPPPLEILVPWTSQPLATATPTPVTSGTTTLTPEVSDDSEGDKPDMQEGAKAGDPNQDVGDETDEEEASMDEMDQTQQ